MSSSALRRIAHVRVFVLGDRWDACVRFYAETLGLTLCERDDEHGHAQFRLSDGPALGLEIDRPEPGEEPASGRFVGVSFAVDDVDAVHASLVSRGVEFPHPPETMFWGGRLAHFRDPSGNVLTLAEYPKTR